MNSVFFVVLFCLIGTLFFSISMLRKKSWVRKILPPEFAVPLCIALILILNWFLWAGDFNFAMPAADPVASGDQVSFAIGLIGLIITALTGMALATAWRAIDDSREAQGKSEELLGEFSRKEKTIFQELDRYAAYIDALRIKTETDKVHGRLNYKVAHLFCAAFSTPNPNACVSTLSTISTNDEMVQAVRNLKTVGMSKYLKRIFDDREIDSKTRKNLARFL